MTQKRRANHIREERNFEPCKDCLSCHLRKHDYFCQLSDRVLKDFDAIKTLVVYPSGTVLFLENDDSRGVFVLCHGQIKLSVSSSEGKTLILQIAEPGAVLGLAAVIGRRPYDFTAQTTSPTQIAFIRRDDFLRFVGDHDDAYRRLVNPILSSYQGICDQLRAVGLSETPTRLAKVLLDWSGGTAQGKTCSRIMVPLTHEEIGEYIGSARETVTRTLSDFKARRLITVSGAAMTIEDRKALEDIADAG